MISKEFDKVLDEIQAILLSFLIKLGPFFVALMPALFSAYAIYHTFKVDAGNDLAMLFAVIVGLALETVGIVATHTAVELYNGKQSGVIQAGKFWLMSGLVPVYVLGVAASVWFSDGAFTPLVKSLGIASPFLTCIVYIAVALARDLASIQQGQSQQAKKQSQIELADLAHKRAIELKKLELEQAKQMKELELSAKVQLELARIERQKPIELALPIREPAKASFICPVCLEFEAQTVQGLNAHKGRCSKLPTPVNGHTPAGAGGSGAR